MEVVLRREWLLVEVVALIFWLQAELAHRSASWVRIIVDRHNIHNFWGVERVLRVFD